MELVRQSANPPAIDWIASNRARGECFKKIMESGDRLQIFAMIAAIDESGRRREAEGKKNFLTDETARAKAERILHSELSLVFELPIEEIPEFIEKNR